MQIFSYVDQGQDGCSPTSQADEMPDKEPITSSEQSDFLQIFLDVKYRNLYTAWAAANEQSVDYTTPAGTKATASKLLAFSSLKCQQCLCVLLLSLPKDHIRRKAKLACGYGDFQSCFSSSCSA